MPRLDALNYEEPPPPVEPDWGFVSFQGQQVQPLDPASMFDRSRRKDIPDSRGAPIQGNVPSDDPLNWFPGGGPKGMINQMIHNQVNPLAGGMQAATQAEYSRMTGSVPTKGGAPVQPPPGDAYGGWKSGYAGPPMPGGFGMEVLTPMPPLRNVAQPQMPAGAWPTHPAIVERAKIPQASRGSGPGSPIPIPFTSGEVRGAVRFILDFEPIAGLSSTPGGSYWVIAEKTAQVLSGWGNSGGWVRLRSSRGTSRQTFHLGNKLYHIRHGGKLSYNQPKAPPAGVQPIDLETATTTWDTEQFRAPEQSTGPAWFGPGPAMAGDGPGGNPLLPQFGGVRPMSIGPGAQVTGARANLNAYMLDAYDAAYAASPPAMFGDAFGFGDPSAQATVGATPPAASLTPSAMINFFPLVQAHPIKKKKCNCPTPGDGCNC